MSTLEQVSNTQSANFRLIRDAISTKSSVEAVYKGRRRQMSPHVLGWKQGREQALFYQFAGESKSGLSGAGGTDNWRCLPIDGLSELKILEGVEWHTAENHSRPQTCVDKIAIEVSF